MLNRYAAPDAEHSGRAEIDRIAVMLAEFACRTSSHRRWLGAVGE